MPQLSDSDIIRGLVDHPQIDFNDLRWINCVLHNADIQDYSDRQTYDNAVRSDDDGLFTLLLVYSFERQGFDSKLSACKKLGCASYAQGYKVKTHPVAVLLGLHEVQRIYGANSIKQLVQNQTIENLANQWFAQAKQAHDTFKRRFNEKSFDAGYLKSFLEFTAVLAPLRSALLNNRLDSAYDLITNKLKGMGPKVAKLLIRDLAFSLTGWAQSPRLNLSIFTNPNVLSYAMPIDIWVRRVSMSIPTIGDELLQKVEISDLAGDDLRDRVDKKLSLTIVNECERLGLNPLRFDLGAYLFGAGEIKRNIGLREIYNRLQFSLNQASAKSQP